MQTPEWTKPAALGVALGVVATAIVGFNWGGWVTGGTARKMADDAAQNARTQIVASLCVDKFASGPDAEAQFAKLKKESSWKQGDFITAGGWATIPGVSKDIGGVANACAEDLVAMDKLPSPAQAEASVPKS